VSTGGDVGVWRADCSSRALGGTWPLDLVVVVVVVVVFVE